jgi:hypothetical protein
LVSAEVVCVSRRARARLRVGADLEAKGTPLIPLAAAFQNSLVSHPA